MRRFALPFAGLLALVAAACSAAADDGSTSTASDLAARDDIFGEDRVADALRGHLDRVPRAFKDAEQLFGVGRACARPDSKEIFVVEEAQTRLHGQAENTTRLLPRTVVTGCNTPEHAIAEANDPQSGSFGLFIALFSDPAVKTGDPMVTEHVEAMALDRKTGLYNFYVFEGGDVQRVRLMPNNDVTTWTLKAGTTHSTSAKTPDRACNNCHVNMGPLMNEMHQPWTNWVSTQKTLPAESNLTGETASIVKAPGFANDLEKIMQAGIRVWVEGLPAVAGSGFAQENLDGNQPKAVKGLLKSVFCETELQYATTFDSAPLELFVDPGAAQGAGLIAPAPDEADVFPTLLPIRSEMDKRIEIGLMKKHVLAPATVLATRLFDEENDVFSSSRCALWNKVTATLPAAPAAIDATVRSILRTELAAMPAGPRHDYATALLTDGADPTEARAAYFADLTPRLTADFAKLGTAGGRTELKKRTNDRKNAAQKMFPGDRTPLPLLPLEKL